MARKPVTAAIAAQAPGWEPGTAHGYHAFTYGWIVGERRVSGRRIGAFFRDEIADPLGLDWIGLPCRPAGQPDRGAAAGLPAVDRSVLMVRALRPVDEPLDLNRPGLRPPRSRRSTG